MVLNWPTMPSNGAPFKKAEEKSVGNGSQEQHMTDAVHPFFTGYRHQMADAETSTSDDLRYFCKECDLYFPLSSAAVLDHFEKRAHMPIDSCVYCGGPVCEYFYNGVRSVYHNCGQGTATNSVNSSVIGTIRNRISSCEIS